MKILVTGGAGFVGSHIVDELVGHGHSVTVIDALFSRLYPQRPDYLNNGARYLDADLAFADLPELLADAEGIVHCAAEGGVGFASRVPQQVISSNVNGTARLIRAVNARRTARVFVLLSSFSVYGNGITYHCLGCDWRGGVSRRVEDLDNSKFEPVCETCGGPLRVVPISETQEPLPLETYAASKYAQESISALAEGSRLVTLRLTSVVGGRMRLRDSDATIVARIAGWASRGERVQLFEDGNQERDWVSAHDVARTVSQAITSELVSGVTNVCSGVATKLCDAAKAIVRGSGRETKIEFTGEYRGGDLRHCVGDPSRFESLFGWRPGAPAEHLVELGRYARAHSRDSDHREP